MAMIIYFRNYFIITILFLSLCLLPFHMPNDYRTRPLIFARTFSGVWWFGVARDLSEIEGMPLFILSLQSTPILLRRNGVMYIL